ncbi:MAG TPA: class II fumarate hydratase [Nitrospirae bacterium]|nr:fumarate hydratase class II [bacterium BMS3Abin08]HDY70065.1 class II fumarate hydratase [Nitrospirota bacterium]
MPDYRIERDSLGEVRVPSGMYYGAQTQRAVENFPVSGIRFPGVFLAALGLIKRAAAEVNAALGLLDKDKADLIVRVSEEVASGELDNHFPLDIFQTGSGTSTNMNANEVIAGRAAEILTGEIGHQVIHPNDHVNMGQSSNDVIPTAIHLSASLQIQRVLLPALNGLLDELNKRAAELDDIVKTGRTHLMDAMPVRMGQEVSGWAHQVKQSIERIGAALPGLSELAIGGTAVGTGINTHPEFGRAVAGRLSELTGITFVEAENHFAAQSVMDAVTGLSGALKTTASSIMKIANDLRLMNSGPISGFNEIRLPALQPGSSIMPGKINPVICESVMMVCAQVMGNDVVVTISNSWGNFQLNVMLPVIAHNILQSITILGNAVRIFAEKAVSGFEVNRDRIDKLLERNPILVTSLNPLIGYEKSAEIAKKAYKECRSVKDVAKEMTDLTEEEIERIIDPRNVTGGG